MKKRLIFLSLLSIILLLASFISAQKTIGVDTQTPSPETIKQEVNKVSQIEVTLPQIFAWSLGVKEGKIEISYLVIIVVFTLVFFILLLNVFPFIPLFENKFLAFLASLASTFLLSVTGMIKDVSVEFFNFWNLFDFLKGWPILQVVISVVIAIISIIGAVILINKVKRDSRLAEAEIASIEAGTGLRALHRRYSQEMARVS